VEDVVADDVDGEGTFIQRGARRSIVEDEDEDEDVDVDVASEDENERKMSLW